MLMPNRRATIAQSSHRIATVRGRRRPGESCIHSNGLEPPRVVRSSVVRWCSLLPHCGSPAVSMHVPDLARVRNRDYSGCTRDVQNAPDVRWDAGQDKVDPCLPGGAVDLEQGTDARGPAEADATEIEQQHSRRPS